jgi:hypothetical protein
MRLPVNSGWLSKRLGQSPSRDEGEVSLLAARAALVAHLKASGPAASPAEQRDAQRARQAVRELCEDAHRRHLQAEQLLIAIKDAWRAMPEARANARLGVPHDSLDRFISLCIEEYYARRD